MVNPGVSGRKRWLNGCIKLLSVLERLFPGLRVQRFSTREACRLRSCAESSSNVLTTFAPGGNPLNTSPVGLTLWLCLDVCELCNCGFGSRELPEIAELAVFLEQESYLGHFFACSSGCSFWFSPSSSPPFLFTLCNFQAIEPFYGHS